MAKIIRAAFGKSPHIASSAFIAEGVVIIGDIEVADDASIWYRCVLRVTLVRSASARARTFRTSA